MAGRAAAAGRITGSGHSLPGAAGQAAAGRHQATGPATAAVDASDLVIAAKHQLFTDAAAILTFDFINGHGALLT
jgi:hypothetical protein